MERRGPGRRRRGLAEKAQAGCFHRAVKGAVREVLATEEGEPRDPSDEELDRRFVDRPEYLRTHTFRKMGREGSDPESKNGRTRRGFSVVERVEADPSELIARSAEVYRSDVWRLVTPPRPQFTHIKTLMNTHLEERAANPLLRTVRALHINDMRDADIIRPESGYAAGIRTIAKEGTFNALALLCALRYEADLYHAKPLVDCIEDVLQVAHFRCLSRYHLSADAGDAIRSLLTLRFIWGCWDLVITDSMRAHVLGKEEPRPYRPKHLPPLQRGTIWVDLEVVRFLVGNSQFRLNEQVRSAIETHFSGERSS